MSTSDEFANITAKKLLNFGDLNDRILEYLKNIIHESLEQVWDLPVVHDTALALEADGIDGFKITGTSVSSDGKGHLLKINEATVNDGIIFENSYGVDYYVALKYTEIPSEIDINPRTGYPEYRKWIEEIGEKSVPDSVTDNGNGTITFQVDSVTESGVSNAGRLVMVYKLVADKNASTAAVAIETCTVAWVSSENRITTTGTLGQSVVSEVASDYNVILLGPTVKRYTDLRSTDGYVYIGYITGNEITPATFNMIDQQVASVSLSEIAEVVEKAPNDRLKIVITPDSAEVGINQLTIRGTSGENLVTIDERGVVTIPGIPNFNTRQYPISPSVAITNTEVITSLTKIKAIAACVVEGKRKIFAIDQTTKYAELWDVETMTLDSTQDLTSHFYNSSLEPCSACGDGKYVYIWSNYLTFTYVNAIDVTDWSAKTGWGATGASMGTTGSGPDVDYIGKMILNVDSERLGVARWHTSGNIALVSKTDGSIISSGSGDVVFATKVFQPRAICFDGKYIYALQIENTPNDPSYLGSASIDNLSVGCGGTGWPKSVSTASYTYPGWIATVDNYVLVSDKNSSSFWAFSKNGTTDYVFNAGSMNHPGNIRVACDDGIHAWLDGGYHRYDGSDTPKRALFRFNHNSLVAGDSGTSTRIIDAYSRYFEPFVLNSNLDANTSQYGDLSLFDGNDLFYAWLYDGDSYYRIQRVSNILFKNASLPNLIDQYEKQITISGGGITIDCEYDFQYVNVNQNITSVSVTNYVRNKKVRVFFLSSGSYTVDGFETSGFKRWLASPRPSFSLVNGSHYLLEITCRPSYTYLDWKGPYTSL